MRAGGSDRFIACPCNTSHILLEERVSKADGPWLHTWIRRPTMRQTLGPLRSRLSQTIGSTFIEAALSGPNRCGEMERAERRTGSRTPCYLPSFTVNGDKFSPSIMEILWNCYPFLYLVSLCTVLVSSQNTSVPLDFLCNRLGHSSKRQLPCENTN